MRIPEQVILSALQKGACIKTFYRVSARLASSTDRRIPDGYVLESPGEKNEVILSHIDFQSVEKRLAEAEIWEQIVGSILLGGSTWTLRPDMGDE
ncbi:cytoplasmic protein [Salmonella enterica]|nr:cytoplasmic protein [Salmonella enterica]EGM2345286.1 cytoplasmic protein [Salmonella enterica]EGM2363789.1 cytoplasmic protein [Salmonella enterica]